MKEIESPTGQKELMENQQAKSQSSKFTALVERRSVQQNYSWYGCFKEKIPGSHYFTIISLRRGIRWRKSPTDPFQSFTRASIAKPIRLHISQIAYKNGQSQGEVYGRLLQSIHQRIPYRIESISLQGEPNSSYRQSRRNSWWQRKTTHVVNGSS